MSRATVDIILPTFCRPHTVAFAIESVRRQTHADFRLHVVGDGCDERSEAIVTEIATRDPRVRFRRFPKGMGYGYAHRNEILRATDGPFVAYMTDDDLWLPDHLARGIAELEARDASLVAFRSCPVQVPDTLDPYFFAYDWQVPLLSGFVRNWFMGSVNCVHRRAVFDSIGYWNDHLFRFGDREFYNRVRVSPLRSTFVDEITVLRFFALHWDGHYAGRTAVPQEKYLPLLQQPAWCDELRAATRRPGRSAATRATQLRDFFLFAVRSGPKFLRFLYQRRRWPTRP